MYTLIRQQALIPLTTQVGINLKSGNTPKMTKATTLVAETN